MFEPTQRQVDHDLQQSMELFKRAEVGQVVAIEPAQPQRVLLALDGSSQDALGQSIAVRLKERLGCELAVVDAREPSSPPIDHQAADTLGGQLDAQRIESPPGESFERILSAVAEWQADLLVVPCPFGRDFESVGVDSTGTVIDVLLARAPIPLIATRAPFHPQGDVFNRLRMVLIGENEAASAAARWAVGLAHPHGRLELMLLVEEEFYENVHDAMQSIQPDAEISFESLENALARMYARLHAGLQRSSRELDFHYELLIRREGETETFSVGDPASHPPLLVLALERADHGTQGHVHDLIRRSPHPVLVVAG